MATIPAPAAASAGAATGPAVAPSKKPICSAAVASTAPPTDFSSALREFTLQRNASIGLPGASSADVSIASSTSGESVRETPVMVPADQSQALARPGAIKQDVPLLDVGELADEGDDEDWAPARVSKGDAQAIRDILLGNVKAPNHISAGVGKGGWMKLVPEWEGPGKDEVRRGSV